MNLLAANWDDLKFVLAVADAGSVNAAARKMGVNHATVLRRITHLEEAIGVQIFNRTQEGYRPTRDGRQIIAGAAKVREEIQLLDRSLDNDANGLAGNIRVTTTDSLLVSVVGDALHSFQTHYPSVTIELVITNQVLSLNQRRADVAIRPTRRVPDGMTAHRVCAVAFAIYASDEYLAGDPTAPSQQSRWLVIDSASMTSPTQYWMQTHHPEAIESVRADTFVALTELAEKGQGLAVLPCCLGSRSLRLRRVSDTLSDIETGMWVMTPNEIAASARIEAFYDHMTGALATKTDLLEGKAESA